MLILLEIRLSIHVQCIIFSFSYSRASPQRPPWGQKRVAVVEKWLLWGDRGVIIYAIFFREYNMFIVLNSCLLSPIMIIIQSKII